MNFTRQIVDVLRKRINQEPKFIQIVVGPRQVGKTTAVRQLEQLSDMPSLYAASDVAGIADPNWIRTAWARARALAARGHPALLILDEVQLMPEWQRIVKGLWDEDRHQGRNLHVVITGSSALVLTKGGESLAGRFEKHELLQWSYSEMRQAFGFSLDDFILFGGYPAAADLKEDEKRWKEYIRSSLIETVLTKDVVALGNISKPSLLRQLFSIVCQHPAEIVAYSNFLGQLADAGNTTTLSDYRLLLERAYLLKTFPKFSGSVIRLRAAKPKWIIRDNSLITALVDQPLVEISKTPFKGRLVENAILAHLSRIADSELYYWREKNAEVDVVLQTGGKLYCIEIKSGQRLRSKPGLKCFADRFHESKPLIFGAGGIPLEEVLEADSWKWEG